MTICKSIALSALLFSVVFTQQMVGSAASPIRTNQDTLDGGSHDITVVKRTEGEYDVDMVEISPSTTQPPSDSGTPPSPGMFDGYPESEKLKYRVYRSGMFWDLQSAKTLPTALWNTTAVNKTEACLKYLEKSRDTKNDSESCAPSYVCDVTENLRRFPAALIRAECEQESRCINSFHLGLGIVPGSRGSCQAFRHITVKTLVFREDQEPPSEIPQSATVEGLAGTQTSDLGAGSGAGELETELEPKGEWIWTNELIPIDCNCRAK